jgi:hypothetical protein
MVPTVAALNVILFLSPGLIALWLGEAISSVKNESEFDRIAAALIFTVFSTILYTLVWGIESPIPTVTETGIPVEVFLAASFWRLGTLYGIAAVWGIIYGIYGRVGTDLNVWASAFREQLARRPWVRVTLHNGTQIVGWTEWAKKDKNGRPEMLIRRAELYDQKGTKLNADSTPDVLLTGDETLEVIPKPFLR